MNWHQLITTKRFGQEDYHKPHSDDTRSEFQRDFDRLIFSAPFRRLQNKTQVFPLPGSIFVHNRLTHSLEVACVGRSLSERIAITLKERHPEERNKLESIGDIVSAACLAHDMGNPPFGHSGERAIQTFFSEGEGKQLQNDMSDEQWADCTCFEGNANAFRLLTHQFIGRREGGFVLTYPTIASVIKYPFSAINAPKKKFGYFTADKENFARVATELGTDTGDKILRHPLVYLTEAADDICYQIMDLEDAFKLKILTMNQTQELLLSFLSSERQDKVIENMQRVADENEQIAYLRSCAIATLTNACCNTFLDNEDNILNGSFNGSLIKNIDPLIRTAYEHCSSVAVKQIYSSQTVLDVELAGYKIIYMLMRELTQAAQNPDKAYSRQLLQRIPPQYNIHTDKTYDKTIAILDYISGMTDVYALDLYQKITGMSLPSL